MMRLIRRRVRGLYAVQAVLFLLYGIGALTGHGFRIFFLYLVLGAVNGYAFWSTRKPSEFRNPWAISASALALGGGLLRLWLHRATLSPTSPGVLTVIMGVAGLAIYSQGRSRREARKTEPPAQAEPLKLDGKAEPIAVPEPRAAVTPGVFASDRTTQRAGERTIDTSTWDPVRVLRDAAMQKASG